MSKRAAIVIGCSTHADYNFLLPLTALLWQRIGHHPLALLVGSESEWRSNPRLAVAFAALDEYQISRVWLGRLSNYPDATLAQNSRQCAAACNQIFDDTWIFPADADLWPLRRGFYQAHGEHRAVTYYWCGDHFLGKENVLKNVSAGQRFQTIPTCHVAMRARDWRAIYGITPGEPIAAVVQRTLDAWFARFPRDDFNVWMSDQDIMTVKLCEQEWFPVGRPPEDGGAHASGDVLFVGRSGHPPNDRLDRGHPHDWEMAFDPGRWTDAHVHKTPASLEHWCQLLPIIEAFLPQHVAWAKKYHRDYLEASR